LAPEVLSDRPVWVWTDTVEPVEVLPEVAATGLKKPRLAAAAAPEVLVAAFTPTDVDGPIDTVVEPELTAEFAEVEAAMSAEAAPAIASRARAATPASRFFMECIPELE
jgi:hypothetical protein